ncbi:hypothetical protein, partial [Ventosimonas gracilis]|uniref:hypothetical protein n=1 Tax=Ventosimonas gracilis TaxID=1680762 RepID=UPI0013657317
FWNWLNAPSLREVVEQQGRESASFKKDSIDYLSDVWKEIGAIRDQATHSDRRLSALEKQMAGNSSVPQDVDAARQSPA